MPEGPSIVILREEAAAFVGRTVRHARGNARIDMQLLPGRRVAALRSFGKQFLIALSGELTVRVHLLLFGSYRIDGGRDIAPRLHLGFDEGELNFYTGSVRLLEGDLDTLYDWRGDVMSDRWSPALAREKLRAMPHALVCDALLDQNVFAGVGNIIKNGGCPDPFSAGGTGSVCSQIRGARTKAGVRLSRRRAAEMWTDRAGPKRIEYKRRGDVQKARRRQRAACQGGQPCRRHALPPAGLLDVMPPALNGSGHPQVLYRIRVHPLSAVGALSAYKLRQLVEQARVYAFEFLAWKKAHVLARHWLVHNRGRCPRHDIPLQRAYLGRTHRRSFFCLRCQKLYTDD